MRDSVRLGRIGGVTVGVHWSLVVMVALVASGLSDNRFVVEAPGYGTGAYATAGALTALGLLVGVFLHELAHAVTARWQGLTVDGITLGWMGGITRIGGDTRRPRTELLVAGVGPLTSAVVGGALWGARGLAGAWGAGALPLAALGWLAWINLVLAVFNMLPASPLDGGRVLHAVMWAAGHDRWRATRVSAGIGMAFGGAVVVAGFVVTERQNDLFDGVLTTFIGWWLLSAARTEMGNGAAHRRLQGLSVSDVMRPVGEAPGWVTVRAFVDQYSAGRPGWVWLLHAWNDGYAGILAGDSLSAVPWSQWDLVRPLDVAVPMAAAVEAAPDEDLLTAIARTGGARTLIVVSDGHTVGAVLPTDIEALVRSGPGGAAVRNGRPAPRRA